MRLFKVEYTDKTVYKQNKEDKSKLDPKRSCFYDVLNSGKDILSFEIGPIKLDLTTGIFHIGGFEIQQEENLLPLKRKLIFFRQHTHDFNTYSQKETSHVIKCFVGYEYRYKGKNIQKVMGFE